MADNSTRTPGTGEDVRSKDRSGVKTQAVIIDRSGGATENLGQIGTPTVSSGAPTASAASMLAANASRKVALIRNAGTMTVYLGTSSGVTTANGFPLEPGETFVDDATVSEWFGIVASGTGALRVIEVA